jgi:glutaredoxin
VKEFLRAQQVDFESIDVSENADAMQEIRTHTGGALGTPTVVIDGEARIGFLPGWMSQALGL